MLISGKISTGIVRTDPIPRISIKIAMTTNVYGRLKASLTTHIGIPLLLLKLGVLRRETFSATLHSHRIDQSSSIVNYPLIIRKGLRYASLGRSLRTFVGRLGEKRLLSRGEVKSSKDGTSGVLAQSAQWPIGEQYPIGYDQFSERAAKSVIAGVIRCSL
jgi:hypothetical protein